MTEEKGQQTAKLAHPTVISDTELVEKYGRLCGHIAWVFVRRSRSASKLEDQPSSTLGTEDAEDLASQALISLIKCPQNHRHEPPYVKRLIVNAIIKAWRKRLRVMNHELTAMCLTNRDGAHGQFNPASQSVETDWFDMQPGPDGLAGKTQVKYDSATMIGLLPQLPESERVVLELSFGLNGCNPCSLERIAKKLGRTKYWADVRLRAGLNRLREINGIHVAGPHAETVAIH